MKLPHWYLELLAVDPKYQGQGFARMLLKPFLKHLDKKKLPIWLVTTTKRNLGFFEKFDFSILEEIIIPNTNIVSWFMVRYGEL
jgi:ribosomal protein S18 acetylase RimI-like enzyme